jgi:hypothetical protein
VNPAHPPIEQLLEAGARLDGAGIAWGLGGSGLLHALGLAEHVGDWDLQTDAGPEDCERAFAGRPWRRFDANGCHADHKLTLLDAEVEIVIRFAFATPRGVVRVPARRSGAWRGVPLAGPEGWAVAYWLLGELEHDASRTAKAEALLAHLAAGGADVARVAELRAQPLPPALDARLAVLPARHRDGPRVSPP